MHLFPLVHVDLRLALVAFLQDRSELVLRRKRFEFAEGVSAEDAIIGTWRPLSLRQEEQRTRRPDATGVEFTRVDSILTVGRAVLPDLLTFFLPLLLIAGLQRTLLWSEATEASPINERIKNGLTLILTTVAMQFTQQSRLPGTHYITLMHYLFIVMLVTGTAVVALATVKLQLVQRKRPEDAARLDAFVRRGQPVVLVLLAALALLASSLGIG
jgi:hypothetical protein